MFLLSFSSPHQKKINCRGMLQRQNKIDVLYLHSKLNLQFLEPEYKRKTIDSKAQILTLPFCQGLFSEKLLLALISLPPCFQWVTQPREWELHPASSCSNNAFTTPGGTTCRSVAKHQLNFSGSTRTKRGEERRTKLPF